MQSKTSKYSRGVMWSAVERFSLQGSQFIVSLIVARLLLPADYGIIAMMSIFISISISLIDSGMAQALVQRQGRSEADLSTALIFNVAVAVGLYSIIYVSAPLIALFYDVPQLTLVARVYSLILVVNSLSVVQQALISIALDFKRLAVASFSGIIVGGVVAIYLAYAGYGVWALVLQQLVSALISNLLLWLFSPWRPKCGFSWASFWSLSNFGSKIMVSGLLHVVYTNMYTLIIGKQFAQGDLGLYNRATTIAALPSSNLSTIVERALYPILCVAQESVREASQILVRYLRIATFVVFPLMVGIVVEARALTLLLLGEQWLDVVPLLQIVALANMWDPIMKFYGSFIRSQGRSADFLRAESLKKCFGVVILVVSVPFGLLAMCGGLVLYAVCDMVIVIFFVRRISPMLGYRGFAREVIPTFVLAVLMGGGVWCLSNFVLSVHPFMELVVAFIVGGLLFLGGAYLLNRPELRQLIWVIKGL